MTSSRSPDFVSQYSTKEHPFQAKQSVVFGKGQKDEGKPYEWLTAWVSCWQAASRGQRCRRRRERAELALLSALQGSSGQTGQLVAENHHNPNCTVRGLPTAAVTLPWLGWMLQYNCKGIAGRIGQGCASMCGLPSKKHTWSWTISSLGMSFVSSVRFAKVDDLHLWVYTPFYLPKMPWDLPL